MTKIEQVARALHASLGYEASWPTPECTQCMDAARAAIEAMREPTEEMIIAAADTPGIKAVDQLLAIAAIHGAALPLEFAEDMPLNQAWRAMIDAALNEKGD